MTSGTQRRTKAADLSKAGRSRQPWKDIVKGMKSSSAGNPSEVG